MKALALTAALLATPAAALDSWDLFRSPANPDINVSLVSFDNGSMACQLFIAGDYPSGLSLFVDAGDAYTIVVTSFVPVHAIDFPTTGFDLGGGDPPSTNPDGSYTRLIHIGRGTDRTTYNFLHEIVAARAMKFTASGLPLVTISLRGSAEAMSELDACHIKLGGV